MTAIPDKLKGFMCYEGLNSRIMVGVADITLPVLTFMSDTLQGAGIAGEVDVPATGIFSSLTATVNWHSLVDGNIRFAAPRTYFLDFQGSLELYDHARGEFREQQIRVAMKANPKSVTLGTFNVAAKMGTSAEFELIYLNISIDGNEHIELDKFAYIFRVNGHDFLRVTRRNMGLA